MGFVFRFFFLSHRMLNVKGLNHSSRKRYYFIGGKNCPPSFPVPSSLFSGSGSFASLSVPGFCFPLPDGIPFGQLSYRTLVFCSSLYRFETVIVVGVISSARCISAYWLQSFPRARASFGPAAFSGSFAWL